MKSRLSLRNSARPALLFSLLLVPFLFSGCSGEIKPTYKEKDIPRLVKKICKDDYNLEITTRRTKTTLWIYAPLDKILHKDYGKVEDKIFDENVGEKLRNIMTASGRVLISADKAPEFYGILASDTKLGLDYIIAGSVLDIKKSYAGFIPWTEANRRYIVKLDRSPEAVGDQSGTHLRAINVTLPDFIAEQISQRIYGHFQEEEKKKYFKVEKCEGRFNNGIFFFEYDIKNTAPMKKNISIENAVLEIITYCIKTYEFRDFSNVEITDLNRDDRLDLNRAAIWARPNE